MRDGNSFPRPAEIAILDEGMLASRSPGGPRVNRP
jgi:hypothetical protein